MAREVVEAEAAGAVEVDEGVCWEVLEARLVAAEEVPLDEAAGPWGVRSLLGLRVEPTSLRKREFMDDIQRGAFLAVA
jgi:hypothetical protein